MQLKIVDSRPWYEDSETAVGTIYTVFLEDENGSDLVEVNVRGDDNSLAELLGVNNEVDTSGDVPTFTKIDDDSAERLAHRLDTPPEAYAAFIRLYLEWMEMSADEQIEYARKNVAYAGKNQKKYANANEIPFNKSGHVMYGEEFDGYVNESWASFGERFTDVDKFAIYLEKNFARYSCFPMSGDMLRRAAQNMMEKRRKHQIASSGDILLSHTLDEDDNGMELADAIPDVTINVEAIATYNDLIQQIRNHIANPVRKQIFDAMMDGYQQKEIAAMLGISPPAVSKHITMIKNMGKNINFN